MNSVLRLIQFLTYSNIWIGIGAGAFTWEYYLVEKLPINYYTVSLAFFATILTYTFQRYVKIINKSAIGGKRLEWMLRNPMTVKLVLIFSTVGCIQALFYISFYSYIVLFFTGLVSVFYAVKVPIKLKKNLRDIPFLKIFLIGLVWATISTFLPYFNLKEVSAKIPWLHFIANFVFVIAITIPFDIRDLLLDEAEKKTIPQLVGEKKARFIAIVLLGLNGLFIYGLTLDFSIVFLLSTFFAILLILKSRNTSKELYFSFLVDGLLILQPACLYISSF